MSYFNFNGIGHEKEFNDYCNTDPEKGIDFKIKSLDDAYSNCGLPATGYNLLAAESNVGKTTILANLAGNYAEQDKKVWFITFEETKDSILGRFVRNYVQINSIKWKNKDLTASEKQRYVKSKVCNYIHIDAWDSASIQVAQMIEIFEKADIEDRPDIIIIDYFTHFAKKEREETTEAMERISRELMTFSNKSKIMIWSAAQLKSEGYKNKGAGLEHIGKSLAAAQLASEILFIREEKEVEIGEGEALLNITIAKTRQGHADKNAKIYVKLIRSTQTIEETSLPVDPPVTVTTQKPNKPVKKTLEVE